MNPPAQIFVWGTGNFGQFGMGPSFLDEVSKPTRNTWVEEKMAQGVFGSGPGSGIVGLAAGGLHSLFIDENGTVCSSPFRVRVFIKCSPSSVGLVLWRE